MLDIFLIVSEMTEYDLKQVYKHNAEVCRNFAADELARKGSLKGVKSDDCLTFQEAASGVKQNISALWRVAPVHEWYVCNKPGPALIRM